MVAHLESRERRKIGNPSSRNCKKMGEEFFSLEACLSFLCMPVLLKKPIHNRWQNAGCSCNDDTLSVSLKSRPLRGTLGVESPARWPEKSNPFVQQSLGQTLFFFRELFWHIGLKPEINERNKQRFPPFLLQKVCFGTGSEKLMWAGWLHPSTFLAYFWITSRWFFYHSQSRIPSRWLKKVMRKSHTTFAHCILGCSLSRQKILVFLCCKTKMHFFASNSRAEQQTQQQRISFQK